MESHNKVTTVLVSLAIGLLVGGGIGWATSAMNNDTDEMSKSSSSMSEDKPNTTTKAADLRVGLNNLLREHVSTNLDVNRAIVDGDQEKITATKAAQTANAVDLASAVGSIYGKDAETSITEMFVEHLTASNDYAMAVQTGDEAAKQAAQKELDGYLDEIAGFFSGAINTLPKDAVKKLLSDHESLMNRATQEYMDNNGEASFITQREAETQAASIADALAGGIVTTQSAKF